MTKIYLLIVGLILTFNLKAQKNQIDLFVSQGSVFSNLEARNSQFEDYVNTRNNQEPNRSALEMGFTYSILKSEKISYELGLNYFSIGQRQERILIPANNQQRESYIHRLTYQKIRLQLGLSHPLLQTDKNPDLKFRLAVHYGITPEILVKSSHFREYRLQNGEAETTENEFEDSLGQNIFSASLYGRLSVGVVLNNKATISLMPSIEYNPISIYKSGFTDRVLLQSVWFSVGRLF